MWIGVISLFPEMFLSITGHGVTGRAVKNGLISVDCWNPRDFTYDRHHTVDDRPYGGGPGMLMMVEPLRKAIHAAKAAAGDNAKVIYLSPQGRKLDQQGVCELAANEKLILVCGRYEGVDERVIQTEIDEEWSVGDYVLSGGELPAMVLIDAVSRFVPVSSDIRHQQKKIPLLTVYLTTHTIPALKCWMACVFRRFYCRETMQKLIAGV